MFGLLYIMLEALLKSDLSMRETVKVGFHQELGGIEVINASFGRKNFKKHYHQTYTISVIGSGGQRFFRSGAEHFAPENSIIFVNADDIHTGQAANGVGWTYKAIYPTPEQFGQLASDIGWQGQFAPYFADAVVYDPTMANALRRLFFILENESQQLLREQEINLVLSQLMIRHGSHKKEAIEFQRLEFDKLLKAREFLRGNVEENVTLKQLADYVGLSQFHLARQFQQKYGLSPHAYFIQFKVAQAQNLLKRGVSVVNVSNQLGFFDQSHLHRHFKRVIGLTPGQYAKAVNG